MVLGKVWWIEGGAVWDEGKVVSNVGFSELGPEVPPKGKLVSGRVLEEGPMFPRQIEELHGEKTNALLVPQEEILMQIAYSPQKLQSSRHHQGQSQIVSDFIFLGVFSLVFELENQDVLSVSTE